MELLNATKMKAAYTMGMKPDGRELLVVVVKGTFDFPEGNGEVATLSKTQLDLVMSDTFSGEPGYSATVYESEFCPFKPRCDVLLNGSAHAPGGKPVRKVQVGLRVGEMTKSFEVVGNRKWQVGLLGVSASDPEPFLEMPISYDRAFGGCDQSHEDPQKHAAFMDNPVGRGFQVNHAPQAIQGKPLPNTEESGQPVTKPNGNYRPMSFGPVLRNSTPRLRFAGTYDQNWIDNVFPFLPGDFDDRYFQVAPENQQIECLRGGEEVVMLNLTPEGRKTFRLPVIEVPVTFYRKNNDETPSQSVIDTILFEPGMRRFSMIWRIASPLKRNMFEVAQVVVGTMPRAWYRARKLGKTYYPSLKALVDERRSARQESSELKEVGT